MQFAPDGRLFVCEQGGRLRVIKNGALLSAPFVSLTVNSSGERGLLGVAFDPAFGSNNYLYVYYTATTPAVHNRISRFTANGDIAVPGSEVVIFELDNLSSATNHNGGALAFGPDGKLYAGVGENGNSSNSQSLNNVLGKVIRINSDGSIPADNPFVASATGKNRAIWAMGLRNPFTMAFHPQGTRFFVNDVGEATWEEINDVTAGANYGWPSAEGSSSDVRFVAPIHAYQHNNGCAIVGGAFYAPVTARFPSSYANGYFFSDYCDGWIRRLDTATGSVTTFATGISAAVDLKISDDGDLYYASRGNNAVYRVTYGASAPSITSHPASQTVLSGAPVTFSVRASGAPPLRYQWLRDGASIPGATNQDYTIGAVSPSDSGARFRATVSNDGGNVLSNEAVLTVTADRAPTGTIVQPAAGAQYQGGSVISYSGSATDPEDGTLPASAFTWWVDFHHDTHTHPFIQATTGARTGSFTIPTSGETSANVWYRIYLSVKDSAGTTQTSFRDVMPRTARVTLATAPAGLQLHLDGQPVATPYSFTGVIGIIRSLEAPSPQVNSAASFTFASWSDGGAAAHTIATPAADATYTATYAGSGSGSPVAFVQSAGKDAGTTTSTSLSFTTANAAGNFIGVVIRSGTTGQTFTVTDSRGNQYQRAVQYDVTLDNVTLAIYYAQNIAGGSNVVQVTSGRSATLRLAVLEYSGIAAAGALDVTAGSQGTGTLAATPNMTTTTDGELVIGAVMLANPVNVTAADGLTLRTTVPANPAAKLAVVDGVQIAAGSTRASASLSATDTWGAVLATFKRAAAPEVPRNPSPADNAVDQGVAPSLSWAASGATSYDIRFGTSSTPPAVVTNATASSYTPQTLSYATRYYWQIVARNGSGATTGPVWSFTTQAAPPQPPPPGGITLRQQAGRDAGTVSSATVAFPSSNTAGNFVAVVVRASGTNQIITITDTAGNQYRKAVQLAVTADGASLAIFYAENIRAGANTVRVALSQSGTLRFATLEYSGIATTSSLDATAAAAGAGATASSGTLTTATANTLMIAGFMTANPATVSTPALTLRAGIPSNPGAKLAVADRVQSSAGANSVTATLGASDVWGAAAAAFKAQ